MKINKLLMSGILSVGILGTTALPAFAATNGTYGSTVEIEVRNPSMDVTVPTTLPMIFEQDGNNILPNNWQVRNNSVSTDIYVASISVDGNESGWSVVADDFDIANTKDMQAIELKMGLAGKEKVVAPVFSEKDGDGLVIFDKADIPVAKGESKLLNIKVERGTFTHAIANAKAFDLSIEFGINAPADR